MLRKKKVHCKVLERRINIRKRKNKHKILLIVKQLIYICFWCRNSLTLLMKAILLLQAWFFVSESSSFQSFSPR